MGTSLIYLTIPVNIKHNPLSIKIILLVIYISKKKMLVILKIEKELQKTIDNEGKILFSYMS